jgi:hypothetical protein
MLAIHVGRTNGSILVGCVFVICLVKPEVFDATMNMHVAPVYGIILVLLVLSKAEHNICSGMGRFFVIFKFS